MDPVIIVGAGPVGLALALALAVQEVPSVILDEGTGDEEHRPARTVVLRADTAAFVERLGCAGALRDEGARWTGWRSMRRGQLMRHLSFSDVPAGGAVDGDGRAGPAKAGSGGTGPGEGIAAPLHVPQHALAGALREALASPLAAGLVQVATGCRLDALEQDDSRIAAHTRGAGSTWWREATWWGATARGPRCASCWASASRAVRRWSATPSRRSAPNCRGRTRVCCTAGRRGGAAAAR